MTFWSLVLNIWFFKVEAYQALYGPYGWEGVQKWVVSFPIRGDILGPLKKIPS